jgi:hypothetical protein
MTKVNPSDLRGPEALFKTSRKAEEEGLWLDYGDFRIRILRAGPNNERFKQEFERRMRPHRRAIQNDALPAKVAEAITREVWARTIIVGWDSPLGDGLIPYGGKAFQFSPENAIQLFTDLPDLFADVRDQSMKFGLFVADAVETDAGN